MAEREQGAGVTRVELDGAFETLDRLVPVPIGQKDARELKVVFRRAKGRADKSAKIAIDRFVLVP